MVHCLNFVLAERALQLACRMAFAGHSHGELEDVLPSEISDTSACYRSVFEYVFELRKAVTNENLSQVLELTETWSACP